MKLTGVRHRARCVQSLPSTHADGRASTSLSVRPTDHHTRTHVTGESVAPVYQLHARICCKDMRWSGHSGAMTWPPVESYSCHIFGVYRESVYDLTYPDTFWHYVLCSLSCDPSGGIKYDPVSSVLFLSFILSMAKHSMCVTRVIRVSIFIITFLGWEVQKAVN